MLSKEINKTNNPPHINEPNYHLINDNIQSILETKEDYSNSSNVILSKKSLKELLEKSKWWELKTWTKSIITDLLTKREEFSNLKLIWDKDFLMTLSNKYSEQSKWYKNVIEKLDEIISKDNNLKVADNPAWFSIKTNWEKKEKSWNYKIYQTIALDQYTYIQYMYALAKKLESISNSTNDPISVKVPYNFIWFYSHNDSLVIHFKNKDNKEKIKSAISEWKKEYSIKEEKRQLWRATFSADSKETSFSSLVAENIENWLKLNFWKYENDVLIDLAIEYAIKQSGVIPTIKKA